MNDELRIKIENLIVELINQETKSIRSGRELDKVSSALYKVSQIDNVDQIFTNDNYDSVFNSSVLDRYQYKYIEIIEHEPETDRFSSKYQMELLKKNIINKVFQKLTHESEITHKAYEVSKLEDTIIELEEKLRYSVLEGEVNFMQKVKKYITLPSVLTILVLLVSLIAIYLLGKSAELSIAINFNIGEVIGAVLAGSGIAVAGFSYAMKKPQEDKDNRR
jgi:hypothetical protein